MKVMKNWNFVRVLRLLLAVASAVYAITSKEYYFLFWTALLGYQAFSNTSCCGGGSCNIDK